MALIWHRRITRSAFLGSSAATVILLGNRAHAYYGQGFYDRTGGPAWKP
ncbi:MAG TPA: hypothetical protein VKS44_10515 [Candidatus Acidoferrales bacterium]|nr:hypothetical protein [Candidatus Acidoferrales bacterium]